MVGRHKGFIILLSRVLFCKDSKIGGIKERKRKEKELIGSVRFILYRKWLAIHDLLILYGKDSGAEELACMAFHSFKQCMR